MNVVLKFSPIARRHRHRVRGRMSKALESHLASKATWSTVSTDLDNATTEVADRTPRVHHLSCHSPLYECIVDRTKPVRMLELGSFYGDSLQMWRDYLHPESLLVGIDIDSKFVKIAEADGVHVRICEAQNESFLNDVAAELGPFDVIIDARSHLSSHIVNSFGQLFKNALTDNGVYVVEDVYLDRWTMLGSFSVLDVVRGFIDFLHGHYQVGTSVARFRNGNLVVVRKGTGSEVLR